MSYKTLDKAYSSLLHNRPLVELYEKNLGGFVTDDVPTNKSALCGSTDMGNVTHLVPGIHPHFYIGGVGVNHTRGFTGDAGTWLMLFSKSDVVKFSLSNIKLHI